MAANASQNTSVFVGIKILTQTKLEIDRLRNVFKFLLRNLPQDIKLDEMLSYEELLPLDRYILHCLTKYCAQTNELYDQFNYNKVVLQTQFFVASTLSAFYFDLVKDRLYCESIDSKERKSASTVLFHVLNNLTASISPILPVLCREVSLNFTALDQKRDVSSLLYQFSTNPNWIDDDLLAQINLLVDLKETIRKTIVSSNPTQSVSTKDLNKLELIIMPFCEDVCKILTKHGHRWLKELFQVSNIIICNSEADFCDKKNVFGSESYIVHTQDNLKVLIHQSEYKLCPRCRLYSCDSVDDSETLCNRCDNVMKRMELR